MPSGPAQETWKDDPGGIRIAQSCVWWQTQEETLGQPSRFLAQAMTLGTLREVRWMLSRVSGAELRSVLREPPAGAFNTRPWAYWHLVIYGDRDPPSLPTRHIPP